MRGEYVASPKDGAVNVGSLFAGIGGFDLGFERAGMRTAWQVEIDPYCRRVLERHFPNAKRYEDVQEVGSHNLAPVDLICGGFPCQDISVAGRGEGIDGSRSGLWSEYARIVGELRPRYVVVENVPALLVRGFERVLADLAALGYDAEWDCIPASAFGAPHRRDRIWIVAYPEGSGCPARQGNRVRTEPGQGQGFTARSGSENVADPQREGLEGHSLCLMRTEWRVDHWETEPPVGRLVDGLPGRVEQLRALGNALVPQVAEWIGRRLMAYEEAR